MLQPQEHPIPDGWEYARISRTSKIVNASERRLLGRLARETPWAPEFEYATCGRPRSVRRYYNGRVIEAHFSNDRGDVIAFYRVVASIHFDDLQTLSRLHDAVTRVSEALAEPAGTPPSVGAFPRVHQPAGDPRLRLVRP